MSSKLPKAEFKSVLMDLVELSSKFSAVTDYLGAKSEEIAGEIKGMLEQTGEHREQTMLARNIEAPIHQLLYLMEHTRSQFEGILGGCD